MSKPTECVCDAPGWCKLMNRRMHPVRWDECKNKPHYFEMFLDEATGARRDRLRKRQEELTNGPGSELARMLAALGFSARPGCQCGKHITVMNDKGVDWCKMNTKKIVGWLKFEAKRQRMRVFSVTIAKLIVRRAISRAEKKLQRAAFANPPDGVNS